MNSVMDCIQTQLFRAGSQFLLAVASAVLSGNTQLEVLFGVSIDTLTQQLCEFRSMLCLFIGGFLIIETDLRIPFTMRLTRHCQIHANLGALAVKVHAKVVHDIFGNAARNAHNVFRRPSLSACLLREFGSGSFALRAFIGSRITLVNVSAYRTYKLFHFLFLLEFIFLIL